MHASSTDTFVGRQRELDELRQGLDDAAGGRGRLFLLAGDPGIGKTRLADEIAAEAAARGAAVLWASCWDAGAPAFWPWVQVLRGCLRLPSGGGALSLLSDAGPSVAQLIPETRALVPAAAAPVALEPEEARFRLFDAATAFLRGAAEPQPLVLIFDDLDAADASSVLLLRFLARHLRGARLLILATYRETEVRRSRALGVAVGALARDGVTLPLVGLGYADVERFTAAAVGRAVAPDLVAAIHEATAGNPLFVREVVRLMVAEGRFERNDTGAVADFRLPHHVGDAVRHRVQSLAEPVRRTLAVAAAIGPVFTLPVLAGAGAADEAPDWSGRLLDLLGEAVGVGVIKALSAVAARYAFVHAIFRETLYEELLPSARAQLHERIGEVLEAMYAGAADPPLAELAHHFVAAGSPKGAAYARRAAEDAQHRLAYEEAAHWYQVALDALARTAPAEEHAQLALWQGLASTAADAGDDARARHAAGAAAALAKKLDASATLSECQAPADRDGQGTDGRSGAPTEALPSQFRQEGAYWTITFTAQTFRLKGNRGLAYIAQLLRHPDEELHSLAIVRAVAEGCGCERCAGTSGAPVQRRDRAAARIGRGATGAATVLDAPAKAAYKHRLDELRAEEAEARRLNDLGRCGPLQQEIDALTSELAHAAGLGGRDRRLGSEAERARINVARTVGAAIRKIRDHHPALGRYLAQSIRTGTFCSYTPDPRVPVSWEA